MFRAGLHPNPSAGRGKHGACPRRRLIHLASLSVLPTCRVHSFSCLSCRGPSRQAVSKDEQAGHRTWASRGTDPTLQQRADGRTGAGAPEKISEPMEPWPKARPWRYLSTRRINWSFRGAVVKPALLDAAFTPRPRWRASFGQKRLGSLCTLPTQGLLDDHASHTIVASGDCPRGSECDSHQHVKYRESGSHRVITECDIHGTLAAQVASLHSPTRTKCGQSCSGTRTRAC